MKPPHPHADLSRYQHLLQARAEQLRNEIREALLRVDAERNAVLAQQVHDTKDQAVLKQLEQSAMADVARDARELSDVGDALQRLAGGRYAVCVSCDAQIPAERLDAFPTAKRCLPCQQRHEARSSA